jgi:MoxR-like ATPase
MSGNGKTLMVKQVCAESGRECVRVNVTIETDEDDLIGGFRLVDGNTVWQDGPVVVAMERGAILLLDEVDLGSTKLMCMQPILEGGSLFIKKIGKVVRPKDGFNIIATANTKGKGSEDGRFIGTNFMNEAFLERFSVTFEQEYPSPMQYH